MFGGGLCVAQCLVPVTTVYLLDTNHCSRAIQVHPEVLRRLAANADRGVGTCVIVEAELLFMAYRSDRVVENLRDVRAFIAATRVYGIDGSVAETYAQIKVALLAHFGPRERAQRRRATIQQLGLTDNDLWIAAIAQRNGLIVVSSDGDFARIAEATLLAHESWLPAGSR